MAELRELVQAAEDALHAVREAVEAQGDQGAPAPGVTPDVVSEATPVEAVPEVSTPSEPTVIPVVDASAPVAPAPVAPTGPAVAPSDAPLPV